MSCRAYLVASELLPAVLIGHEWHATTIPGNEIRSLVVVVDWDDPNEEAEFEADPRVLVLGHGWEPLPAAAVSDLTALQSAYTTESTTLTAITQTGTDLPATASSPASSTTTEPPSTSDSVSAGLRRTGWSGGRLLG